MQQKGEEMKRVVSKEIKENHIIGRVESKDPEIKEKIKKAIHRMNRQGIPISYDLVFLNDSTDKELTHRIFEITKQENEEFLKKF